MRKQFAETTLSLAENDESLVLLIGDISHYLLRDFEKKFPDRFFNAGICEQTLIGTAAGLAMDGMKPIVHTIAPFCVERAFEQIKVDLCYQVTDVTIISVGGSFDYGHAGCTHHCYEDISILRSLPNMCVFSPGTKKELDMLLRKTWGNGLPKYFKVNATMHSQYFDVEPFRHHVVKEGEKLAVFVTGHLLDRVLDVDVYHTVVYMPTLSMLEKESEKEICEIINSHEKIITLEENSVIGGLGDLIFDICSRNDLDTKIKKVGIPHGFLTKYGKAEEHRDDIGLSRDAIKKLLVGAYNGN